jgi:hypothetical protein
VVAEEAAACTLSRTSNDAVGRRKGIVAVVQVKGGEKVPNGKRIVGKLKGLNAWCKVTVLRLKGCARWGRK